MKNLLCFPWTTTDPRRTQSATAVFSSYKEMNACTIDLCQALIATPVSSTTDMPMVAEVYFSLYMHYGGSADEMEIIKFRDEFLIFCPTQAMHDILLSFGTIHAANFSLTLMSCVTAYALQEVLDIDTEMFDVNVHSDPGKCYL